MTVHRHKQQHHAPHSSQQLRLKCIVLGSAGAGKTSLLRRYIHGTFEGHPGNEDHSRRGGPREDRRRGRSTTSTLGADYYVKRVDLRPGSNQDDKATDPDADMSHVFVQLWDTAGKERLKPQRYAEQWDRKSNFYQFLSIRPSSLSASNSNNYEHRYNNWGFLNGIHDQEDYTLFTDNHEDKHSIHHLHNNEQDRGKAYRHNNTSIKHGRPLHYHRHNFKSSRQCSNNEPMGDALFRNIDACMLVYDSTSSMSFLHLMQWHSEWVQRLKSWEREETVMANKQTFNAKDASTCSRERKSRRRNPIPFIVVANKLDLLEKERDNSRVHSSDGHKRRSVMGFRGGRYRGQELKYEYAAENATKKNKPDPASNGAEKVPRRNGRLTYSLKETLWSTDSTYLNALQLTEDRLPANRLMILLWCKRNGIPHVEASALDGRGVDEAMEHLIKIGVDELVLREEAERTECSRGLEDEDHDDCQLGDPLLQENRDNITGQMQTSGQKLCAPESTGSSTQDKDKINSAEQIGTSVNDAAANGSASDVSGVEPSQYYFLYQPRQDEKLDLFARYSRNDEQRCYPFKCLLPFISYCQR